MICHDKKAIFIHIPRNAGRSMEAYISNKKPTNPHHKDLDVLTRIKNGEYSDYFTFVIVRNPFDRMVSMFHRYTASQDDAPANRKIRKELSAMGFYSFIKNLDNLSEIIPGYRQELHPFILEQHRYIYDGDDMLLDYVAIYENIEDHARFIGSKLGIQKQFPHKNQSPHDHYASYYDAELIYIVDQKYRRDIELFYPHLSPANGRI